MSRPEHPCPECGSPVEPRSGPGRFRTYRGEPGYEVPAAFEIPTCQRGHLWLDSAKVRELGQLFEAERQRRMQERSFGRPISYVQRKAFSLDSERANQVDVTVQATGRVVVLTEAVAVAKTAALLRELVRQAPTQDLAAMKAFPGTRTAVQYSHRSQMASEPAEERVFAKDVVDLAESP